jgi:hypothetical protein
LWRSLAPRYIHPSSTAWSASVVKTRVLLATTARGNTRLLRKLTRESDIEVLGQVPCDVAGDANRLEDNWRLWLLGCVQDLIWRDRAPHVVIVADRAVDVFGLSQHLLDLLPTLLVLALPSTERRTDVALIFRQLTTIQEIEIKTWENVLRVIRGAGAEFGLRSEGNGR